MGTRLDDPLRFGATIERSLAKRVEKRLIEGGILPAPGAKKSDTYWNKDLILTILGSIDDESLPIEVIRVLWENQKKSKWSDRQLSPAEVLRRVREVFDELAG